jgi:DNA-3-methyladenine glycosylase
MWGPPGHAYVYFTYGMHHCLNLVTEDSGRPAAVLIRALEPTLGVEAMRARRSHLPVHLLLSGPGRVCAGLGLTRVHDGIDLVRGPLFVQAGRRAPSGIRRGPRIGIRRGLDRPWRLWVSGHPSVSAGAGTRATAVPDAAGARPGGREAAPERPRTPRPRRA